MAMELNSDYSVWQVQCPHLHIISQSRDFQHWSCSPYKFQKTWSTSFHSHINLWWLCNLRFDSSKTFGGFAWPHVVLTCSTNAITGSTISFSTNTKIMLMGTQTFFHKILVFFVLSSTTVREVNYFFYYMCVISFKMINKNCLNLIQKACIMVVVIRTKTEWIILETTIWFQVAYNQGRCNLQYSLLQW